MRHDAGMDEEDDDPHGDLARAGLKKKGKRLVSTSTSTPLNELLVDVARALWAFFWIAVGVVFVISAGVAAFRWVFAAAWY